MRTIKPLDLPKFYVLLALSSGPLHGYAIHEQVQADSNGGVYFSYPWLYKTLSELEQRGLIEQRVDLSPSKGPVRKTFALTLHGKRLLRMLGADLHEAGRLAQKRLA